MYNKGRLADWCVERTAYIDARSTDSAETVAKAVSYACEQQVNAAARASYAWFKAEFGGPDSKVVPPTQDESYQRAQEEYAHKALIATVEARAGNCWRKVKP
jgi:hypothetical protein